MIRIAIPLLLSAFLVAYSLRREVRLDVPSNLVAAGADVRGVTAGTGEPRAGMALKGPVEGSLQLTQRWLAAGREVEVHMVADLRGASVAVARDRRPPLNLVLVLDRSGSMRAEGKLRQALAAAGEVIQSLHPEDVLALVTYSTDAELVRGASPVGDGQEALEQLRGVRSGGSTNISEGLELAAREASRYATRDRLTRVLLLSDGKANHGITEREGLRDLAARLHRGGISVTSMGLGLTYDELVLQDLAKYAGGNYYFLETAATASRAFQSELAGLQAVTARDLQLLVSPREGVTVASLGGYPVEVLPDGTQRIRLGALSVGEARKALVRLRLRGAEDGVHRPVVRVRLAYEFHRDGGWVPAAVEGALEVGFSTDPDRQLASRDLAALARVQEERTAALLEDVADQLARGETREAADQLRRFTEESAQKADLLGDAEYAGQVREVEAMALALPGGALDDDERETWVKRSRARAFSLSR